MGKIAGIIAFLLSIFKLGKNKQELNTAKDFAEEQDQRVKDYVESENDRKRRVSDAKKSQSKRRALDDYERLHGDDG